MARLSVVCCFLLVMFSCQQTCTSNPILFAQKAYNAAITLYNGVSKVQDLLEGKKTETAQILEIQREVNRKLDQLSTDFQDMRDRIINKISNELKDKLTEKSDELFTYMKDVQRLYRKFVDFFTNADKFESSELKDFADVVTTASLVELSTTIEKMHEALVDLDIKQESLVSIIAKESTPPDTMCIRGQSSQQLIHDLYEAVVHTDTKGLIITLHGLNFKARFENRTYEFRQSRELKNYYDRTLNTFNKVKEAMSTASREIWKCDPAKHIKEVTYSKLQEIFQGFFVYESDVTRSPWESFVYSCASITDDRLRCRSAPCFAQPAERRCSGHIRDCRSIASWMQICHSPRGSDRRYTWMKTASGDMYGHNGQCQYTQGLSNALSFENCFCDCESEQRDADRHFSLKTVTSDITQNKVVTGVRLVKKEHVFHIQIQQGKLEANGSIIREPEWKKVDEISSTELLSDKVSTYHYVVKSYPHQNDDRELKYDEWVEFYKNDLVYSVTYKQNGIYLDDLNSQPNELLTGLRFKQIENDLRLEIQTTPFDYATGELKKDASKWVFNPNTTPQRQEFLLTEPDDPVRSAGSDLFSHSNEYIRFGMSDLRRDLGQYTVPFIDIQEIVTNPPQPLSGAGIFHKGKKYYGGFLALKLIQYDFTTHF